MKTSRARDAAHPRSTRYRAAVPTTRAPERLFLAIEVTAPVRAAIRAALPAELPGRVVRPEQWHLTVRFLGGTTPAQRDALVAALDGSFDLGRAFTIRLGGLGAFPDARAARVAWLGVQSGAREFAALAERIETIVTGLGFTGGVPDGTPHLTLTRLDPPSDVRRLVGHRVDVPVPLLVDAVCLLRSRMSTQGTRYAELARWRLT